jgi:hypothetical protein
MLINKWLVADPVYDSGIIKMQASICFYLKKHPDDLSNLYNFIQNELFQTPIAVLLSGIDLNETELEDIYIEKLLGLFFQPSYYMVNYHPVLFLINPTSGAERFLDRLQNKSSRQGLEQIVITEITTDHTMVHKKGGYGYWLNTSDVNYDRLISDWLTQYLDKNHSAEIHLLIPYKSVEPEEILSQIQEREKVLKQTAEYKIANALYEKDRLIKAYEHELELKAIAERNNQLYLSIQKAERANALEWYDKEYEVLPLWYKRFGHVIKVLTGKRTFRSLFNDNVKKYID